MPANKPAVVNDHNGPTGCIVASKEMVDNQLRRKIWSKQGKHGKSKTAYKSR